MPQPSRLCHVLPALLGLALAAPLARADDPACTTWIRQANQTLAECERLSDAGDLVKSRNLADQALAQLERAQDLCPGSLDVCGQGVIAAVFAGDWPRARTWLERYAAATPYGERDPQLHYVRALVELRLLARPDLAARSLERMQGLAPGLHGSQRETLYYEALLQWGSQLAEREQYEEALRQFQTAALVARRSERPSKERRARANGAVTLIRARRYDEASRILERLRDEEPANPLWTYQLGQSYAFQFRYPEAAQAYRASLAALTTWSDRPETLAEVAKAHLRLGNCLRVMAGQDDANRASLLEEAERVLRAYIALAPQDPLGPKWLGVLLFEERDDPLGALALFERSFELDRACENTLRYMIRCHARAPGPPTPGGRPPTAEEQEAWARRLSAWQKDLDDNAEARKAEIKARNAKTGDPEGGCM